MKRTLTCLLAICALLSLCACGGLSPSAEGSGETTYTVEKEVLVDNEDCTFTVTKAEESKEGVILKVSCANKTPDKSLRFALSRVSVNGYMVEPFWGVSLPAGEKTDSDILFYGPALEAYGIARLDEVEFTLYVFDENDWAADDILREVYTVYPTGLDRDSVVPPPRPEGGSESVLADNETCAYIILDRGYDSDRDCLCVTCYAENRTDRDLLFSWEDVTVNGVAVDPHVSSAVSAGKREITTVYVSDPALRDRVAVEITELCFTLLAVDEAAREELFREEFTFAP